MDGIHLGRMVSNDQFPAPQSTYPTLLTENVLSIDMETDGLFHAACLTGLPAAAVRGISNFLQNDGTDPDLHRADVDLVPIRVAEIVINTLCPNMPG